MNYSVVMAVYKNDQPAWLTQAIESILSQTVPSNDIVIVADGPLTKELESVLRQYKSTEAISLIKLPANKGLGNALNIGIQAAKHELIGRMDADDIATLNRFELQLTEFRKNPNLAILGGQIAEFIDTPENIVSYRKVPLDQPEIKIFSRRRSPFNHPSVMYKKSVIESLGGYDVSAIRVEDYDLWLRALASDTLICANIDDTLLQYRLTPDTMRRRKTLTSLKHHLIARARFYSRGYISLLDFLYGASTQISLFILPAGFAGKIFNRMVRK